MQFHLNGFLTGDPGLLDAAVPTSDAPAGNMLPADADVLIVGCGPAGLTLAAQLAAFPGIRTVVVEDLARVAQWQRNCFVNSRLGVRIPSRAPMQKRPWPWRDGRVVNGSRL